MKKSYGLYIVGWLAALGLFNVVTFVSPNEVNGVSKFDTLFWVAYACITVFFVVQLVSAYFSFRTDSLQKVFYNFPLFKVSVVSLIAIVLVGGVCMSVIQIPDWIGIIVCSLVVTISVIAIIKSTLAIGAVSGIDQKIKEKTQFIKMLTAEAQALVSVTTDAQMKGMANKVYEAIRYSDPMSDPALGVIEGKISDVFTELSAAVKANSFETAQTASDTLLSLISERNAKCKVLK